LGYHRRLLIVILGILVLFSGSLSAELIEKVKVSETEGNSIANANTSRNVGVSSTGEIYVAWRGENGINISKSEDRGKTFQGSYQVLSTDYEVELAVSSGGVVYLAWVNDNYEAKIARSTTGEIDNFEYFDIGSVPNSRTVHLATSGGNVYAVGQNVANPFYYSTDYGENFYSTEMDEGSSVYADVAVEKKTGRVIVQTDDPDIDISYSDDNGATLNGPNDTISEVDVYYSVGTLTSTEDYTYFYAAGANSLMGAPERGYRIDVSDPVNPTATVLSEIPAVSTYQGRSISADNLGNLVTGYTTNAGVEFAVSTDFGNTFSSGTQVVGDPEAVASAAINYTNGDVMFVYESEGEIYFATYKNELEGYGIKLSTSTVEFESILQGETSENEVLTLTNSDDEPYELSSFSADDPFSIQSNNCSGTLSGGNSCEVEINYSDDTTGEKSGELTFNDGNRTRIVYLKGEVLESAPIAEFDVPELEFINIETKIAVLTNSGNEELKVHGFNISTDDLSYNSNCGSSLSPGKSCEVEITSETIGDYSAVLSLDSNTSGEIPTIDLTATEEDQSLEAFFTYSPEQPTTKDKIEFDASDSDGVIDTYKWDWDGDGSFDATTSSSTTTHSYSDGGLYAVELQVVDDSGETHSSTKEIQIGHVLSEDLINHGPNPVPPEGCIFWLDLPDDASEATLKVYDLDGKPLYEADIDPNRGRHPTTGRWETRDANGHKLGSGFYMYKLKVEHTDGSVTWSDIHKMVIDRSQ